jgi:hypothetical protein
VNPNECKGFDMSLVQSKPTRNADYRHAQSLGQQCKAADAVNPHAQAQAIAAIVRKRIADGQAVPDLDRYHLDDETWTELMAILDADALSAVADTCGGDDLDDSDAEPTTDDITRAFEDDVPCTPEPPAPQQTPHVAHGWRDHEPAIVHSLKWKDADGIEHLHVVRADDLDEALRHIMKVKLCIKAAQLKAQQKTSEPDQPSTTDSRPDWCHVHDCAMKQRGDESKGYWYSHKTTDGWCRGKAKA